MFTHVPELATVAEEGIAAGREIARLHSGNVLPNGFVHDFLVDFVEWNVVVDATLHIFKPHLRETRD